MSNKRPDKHEWQPVGNDRRVFVLGRTGKPMDPCHPARARELLKKGRAVCARRQPFTIRLLDRKDGATHPMTLRLDPGSRATGMALVMHTDRCDKVVWAAEVYHRGFSVKQHLAERAALRRGRRSRNTRHREPRFDNRARDEDWFAPSLKSRVDNVVVWLSRIDRYAAVSRVDIEQVRFDTQQLMNPEIAGAEYQQGTLFGYEVREYLLEKFERTCVYCGKTDVALQIEHVHPKSLGGSNRISNLAIACEKCNTKKGNSSIEVFLAKDPERLNRIKAQLRRPLRDAAAVNATRYEIVRRIKAMGFETHCWTGGRTKFNRTSQGYPKGHWIDAACVGDRGGHVAIPSGMRPLGIKAIGRGGRQVMLTDKYGFPRKGRKARKHKRIKGFSKGDLVRLVQPSGKYKGTHEGALVGIRERGYFDIRTRDGKKITAPWHRFQLLQRADGYEYAD